MKIRDYNSKTDYQQLKQLLVSCGMYYEKMDNEQALAEKIKRFPGTIVVGEEKQQIIGCVYFCVDPVNEFICHLCVKEKYRHKGYGSQLMAEVERRIKQMGNKCEPILLVEENNKRAIKFYQERGWQPHENKKYFMMKKRI